MNSTTIPTYDRYKDSGVEWLGKIPAHWEVLPGRTCLSLNQERNAQNRETQVLSLSYGRVIVKPPEKLTGLVPESFEGYQVISPGDIVVRPTDLQNDKTSLRVGLARDRGIITSAYLGLRHNKRVSSEFLHYLLHAYDLLKVYYGMGTGLRQNLDWRDFKYLPLSLPPKPEQDRIVAFLDEKTAQIDELIAKKQRQIELLDEQKAIRINHAVTRGLNPNAKLKPSGIEWIGDIPEHWEVKRVKHLATYFTSGSRGWGDFYADDGEWFLQSGDLTDDCTITLANAKRVKLPRRAEGVRTRLKSYDTVVCITGAKTGRVANVGKVNEPIYVNQHLCLVRPSTTVAPQYLSRVLNSSSGQTHFALCQYGLKEGLGLEDVKNCAVPIPPPAEQQSIVEIADQVLKSTEGAKEQLLTTTFTLKTLRSTLIAHAVTGKLRISEEPTL